MTVVSSEWNAWNESKSPQAKKIREMLLNEDWWADCTYVVSFTAPIVELIRYADSDSPALGEIYECIDTMVGKVKHIIHQINPSLEFFHEIDKLIGKDGLNSIPPFTWLHMPLIQSGIWKYQIEFFILMMKR